jgi:hypothetical protein
MKQIREFFELYSLYRKHHTRRYSFTRARQIAFFNIPF